jgi:hypothetical protein
VPQADNVSSQRQPAPSIHDAEQEIHELNQGFFWDRHRRIAEFSANIEKLDGDQINALLAGLTDDDLKEWAKAINRLTPDEQVSLFDDLARKANGAQLAKFAQALGDSAAGDRLGSSIAKNSSDGTKLAFIKALAPRISGDGKTVSSGGGLTLTTDNSCALDIANVIASLKGRSVDAALETLNNDQLTTIMRATRHQVVSVVPGLSEPVASYAVSYDTSLLQKVIEAAASGHHAETKARVFHCGVAALGDIDRGVGTHLTSVNGRDEAMRVTNALTTLIRSDTTGVVGALERQQDHRSLTSYAREMLENHRTTDLSLMIQQLLRGNHLTQDPRRFLDAKQTDANGERYYKNARDLGYFLGSIQEAIDQMKLDAKSAADIIVNLILGANQFVPPPLNKFLGLAANAGKQQMIARVAEMLSGNTRESDALYQLAFPRDPKTGRLVELASRSEVWAGFSGVVEHP